MIKKSKKIVDFITGIQPTGNLHIGHFLGVIKKSIDLINS